MMDGKIDLVLRPLSAVAEGCADQILDLRDSVIATENPGRCVRCYFAIYHRIAAQAGDTLLPLRRWLENHIEIVAFGDSGEELERLPVRLEDNENLSQFCERMMDDFHADRAYNDRTIVLRFDFKEDWRSAA